METNPAKERLVDCERSLHAALRSVIVAAWEVDRENRPQSHWHALLREIGPLVERERRKRDEHQMKHDSPFCYDAYEAGDVRNMSADQLERAIDAYDEAVAVLKADLSQIASEGGNQP